MADKVDVAVIGGGVIGLSCARELRRAGVDRVLVLEREPGFGLGSSSRANGGVRAQFTTAINIAFSLYSIGELEDLASRRPDVLEFHQTGYLLFTGRHDAAEGLEKACELQRSLGVETEWLSGEEVAERAPLVRPEGLVAGTFHARDGFLDPWSVVTAMRLEAKAEGADLRTTSEVTSIDTSEGGFVVDTTEGRFETTVVVDAAGSDAAEVAELVGVTIPVEPVRRNMAYIEEDRRELIPMLVDLDTGVLVRRETEGGYVIAYSDPNDLPGRDISLDPKFLEDVAGRIGKRFPTVESMPIDPKHCWAGLYPETPDHHAIVGQSSVPGFYLAVGFGGHGIMHSPAAGKAIAELVTKPESQTFDLHPLRASRFEEGDLVREIAVF